MKKVVRLTESDLLRLVKRIVKEQEFDPKKEYLSKGYVDVTDGFMKDTYVLQIPDGQYKCDGSGYSFEIKTNDGKKTGYVVIINSGIRGMITGPATVSNKGINLSLGQWNDYFSSLLYNEKENQVKKPVKEQRDPNKPVAGGRMNQPQPSQGNKLVMCSSLGVKSPGYCDTKLKKPVDRCASLGVKSPGWCYVDTKQPVPNVQPMDNRPMKDSRGGAVGKSISHT